MTIAPLPDWRNFLTIFKASSVDKNSLIKPWVKDGETAGWLTRSTWSLALIVFWKTRELSSVKPLIVWIPDFFCNEPLLLLRLSGVRLFFYPVTAQFEPEYNFCRLAARQNPPNIFLLVHYFGKPATGVLAKEFCQVNRCWLVEDAAHVLRPVPGIGEFGDFILYSPHKLLALFEGALLIVRKKGPSRFSDDFVNSLDDPGSWHETLYQEFNTKIGIARSYVPIVIWTLKRLLQKCNINRTVFQTFSHTNYQNEVATVIDPKMSNLSSRLLKMEINKLGTISSARRKHYLLWKYIFDKEDALGVDKIFELEADNSNWSPYHVVLKCERNIEKIFNSLQTQNLLPTTWPDLAPEVTENPEHHGVALALRYSRMYLPVHQSLREAHFFKILKKYNRLIQLKPNDSLISTNDTPRWRWHKFLKVVGKSNLLQSWTYGEAKMRTEGWEVQRLVFSKSDEPIALVQILEKRIAGLLKVHRINRGPLFFPNANFEDKMAVLSKLLKLGNIFQGAILLIAPELDFSGANSAILISNKVRGYNPSYLTSAWLDLNLDEQTLRANLNGKWRNALVAAEKNIAEVEIGSGPDLMNWMTERYKENMLIKGFEGISLPVLKELYANFSTDSPLIICRVRIDNEYIAGICIACHGSAATYLIGWSGLVGRELKANYLLLWSTFQYLRMNGFRWFDLGGIDKEGTMGVAEFKLGISGESYSLISEGWKL